jgi:hypothetical protein
MKSGDLELIAANADVALGGGLGADLPLNRYGMAALAVMAVRLGSAATAAAGESAPYGCAISIPPRQVPHASHR